MLKRGLFACAVLGMATSAFAGARIDLRPDLMGPYNPGDTTLVHVWMVDTGNPQGAIPMRGLFLDFADTSTAIVGANPWSGPDGIFLDNPGTGANEAADNTDNIFNWVNPGMVGSTFRRLPNAAWVYPLQTPIPGLQYVLPDNGEFKLGDISVTVPNVPGTYTLDVMNADAADPNLGAGATFGFGGAGDPVTTWRAFTGELTGGTLTMTVIPEPATLALLGVGALAALRRRRTA